MKNLVLIFLLFTISCKAQTISLETAAQCMQQNAPFPCPTFNYAKDISNVLNKYVGHWKGKLNGLIYELKFVKKEFQGEDIKDDRLVGRIRIAGAPSAGFQPLIIFDNFGETDDDKTNFTGSGLQPDLTGYMVYFVGDSPEGCINYGTVYLTVNPGTPDQLSMMYWSDHDIVAGDCPTGFVQTFPEKQVISLIKQ